MAEYIEREAVKEKIERLRDKCGNDEMAFALNWAVSLTGKIPAADVAPVVRCADCKYNITPDKLYAQCNFNYAIGSQDFFCSAGEKRDGDGDV